MRRLSVLFVLLCATSVLLPGQQASEGSAGATIRALEHEWVEGQSRNDNVALDMIFDNALVYVEYGRLVSKGEYLSRIKKAGPQLNPIAMEAITVRAFGNTAVVVGTYREKELKSRPREVRRWRFIDTWVYKKNGWVLVAAAAAPLSK
ncbi:MAG TPA: nuclear transport factor 2 family protein [Candidatus Sulfotelmatobacter sp.]|nr:nuclear transport factor 2 family protein [Candidatus Sulfotelmatobacter sp.]